MTSSYHSAQGAAIDLSDTAARGVFQRLCDAGFAGEIIPIMPVECTLSAQSSVDTHSQGKIPGEMDIGSLVWHGMAKWTQRVFAPEDVRRWDRWWNASAEKWQGDLRRCPNIGIRTEKFPAPDLDIEHADIVEWCIQFIFERLGPTIIRERGNTTRRLLLYRLAEHAERVGKLRFAFTRGEDPTVNAVEFLGRGQQCVLAGMHKSGALLKWEGGFGPIKVGAEGLPEIGSVQWRECFAQLMEALPKRFPDVRMIAKSNIMIGATPWSADDARPIGDADLAAPEGAAVQALNAISCKDADYDRWVMLMHAFKGAGGSCADFFAWCKDYPGNTEENVGAKWDSITSSTVGWSKLSMEARNAGWFDYTMAAQFDQLPPEEPAKPGDKFLSFNDDWVATHAAEQLKDRLRYCALLESFFVFEGGVWRADETKLADAMVRDIRANIANEAAKRNMMSERKKYANVGGGKAIMETLKSVQTIAVRPRDFDRDKWLLNTPGGIVDLRTGAMQLHDPALMCSKLAGVTPADTCTVEQAPEFHAFLNFITGGDAGYIRYLQLMAGYALTGDTREELFWYFHGPAGTGKGTFFSLMQSIAGTYSKPLRYTALMDQKYEPHSSQIAALEGYRLVTTSEVPKLAAFNEARVSELTGRDPVDANMMRTNPKSFTPTLKLWSAGNYLPKVHGVRGGLRRRLVVLPFTHQPAVEDKTLKDRLAAELPQIMRWAIDGAALAYAMYELRGSIDDERPAVVRDATAEYWAMQEDLAGELLVNVLAEWRDGAHGEPAPDLVTAGEALKHAMTINPYFVKERPSGNEIAEALKRAGAVALKRRPDMPDGLKSPPLYAMRNHDRWLKAAAPELRDYRLSLGVHKPALRGRLTSPDSFFSPTP